MEGISTTMTFARDIALTDVKTCQVPSFSTDSHGVVWFDMTIQVDDEGWTVRHRYSQFLSLHDNARQHEAIVGTIDCEVLRCAGDDFPYTLPKFPGKSWTGRSVNGAWLEERRSGLDKWMQCLFKGCVHALGGVADSSSFLPLVKLETLLLEFLEVPQNAERCRQRRIDDARQVLRATARSADENQFSDSESDGLSVTDSDDGGSDCSWEDLSSEVSSLCEEMCASGLSSSSGLSGNGHGLTLTALREHNLERSAAELEGE